MMLVMYPREKMATQDLEQVRQQGADANKARKHVVNVSFRHNRVLSLSKVYMPILKR